MTNVYVRSVSSDDNRVNGGANSSINVLLFLKFSLTCLNECMSVL